MNDDRNNLLKGYNLLLYFAGSMVLSEPTDECVIDFWTKGILKRLPVSSSNPRFIKAAGILRESCSDGNNCRKLLSEDYHRLLMENGLLLAPAFASHYPCKGGTAVERVSEFYSLYGWIPKRYSEIPYDHLGIELLFLTRMVDKYLVFEDYPSRREMGKEISRFIDQHILPWIPGWCKDVEEHAHSLCYKGISLLIYACMEDLSGIFSSQVNPK